MEEAVGAVERILLCNLCESPCLCSSVLFEHYYHGAEIH